MAAVGKEIPGYKPADPHQPIWAEESPIACLDGCRCQPYGARHRPVDLCSCQPGYRCAAHCIQDCLTTSYPGRFFETDSVFNGKHSPK